MARDVRNRFLVTFALAVAVTIYSPLVTDYLGIKLKTPFSLPNDIFLFLLSTPAVLWGGNIFLIGAYRALKNRILDMSVLIALSVGAGYLFSILAWSRRLQAGSSLLVALNALTLKRTKLPGIRRARPEMPPGQVQSAHSMHG